ncbi:MAG: hypothetical protein JSV30_05290 [Candidatus Omnitrophota bacterium]|nr:MAG: hypothetical protein JSV30_05290 [Candidatus Omnitrophota bacterium]
MKLKIIFILVVLSLFCKISSLCLAEENNKFNEIKTLRAQGSDFLEKEQYDSALPKFKKITELLPDNPSAHMDYGSVLFASASKYFKRDPEPSFDDAAIPILQESTIHLKKAAELYGDEKESRSFKSHAYYLLGDIYQYGIVDIDQAKAMYQRAVVINPDNEAARDKLNRIQSSAHTKNNAEDLKLTRWVNAKHAIEIDHPKTWFIKEIGQTQKYRVYFSVEDINKENFYYTGIGVTKFYNYIPKGATFDKSKLLSLILEETNELGQLLWCKTEEITTDYDYEGLLAKIKFINYKGETEIEYCAIFSKDTTMVNILCEAPDEAFPQYDSTFRNIIMKAKLFNN